MPPPKRARSSDGHGHPTPPPPPLRLLFLQNTPDGLTQADLEAPSDALAALLLLRSQFPAPLAHGERPCPPIALASQLAFLLPSSTRGVGLEGLATRRIIRPLRLPTLPGSAGGPASVAEAWVFESDLKAAAGGALERAGHGEEAAAAARTLLQACPGAGLTHARLVSVLGRRGGGGEEASSSDEGDNNGPPSSSSSDDSLAHHPSLAGAAAVTQPRAPAPPAVDALIAALLRVGVLARAVPRPGEGGGGGATERYLFSIPGGGGARFVKGVAAGRAALLGALRRRRGGIAPMPGAGARLGGSAVPLDARFVVRDCIGGGWVERVDAPGGVMLRVAEGRETGGGAARGR